ncbi:hypothetical protein BGZ96_011234, partial [Linnemannia gamsii]
MTGATTTAAAAGVMTKDTPTYLRGRFQTKEAEEEEEAQAAAAKLREASKKANAQLPSDDEGSDASSDDSEDESGLSKKQRRLLAQQQHQHQLFLEQQEILQQQLAGVKGAGVGGLDGEEEEEKKPVVINHESVIDRMKDRHRALLQGAHAAHTAVAREEYYEDYRDDFAMMQQQQGMLPPGGGPMVYNMQYGGMDPSMMYTDDYRLQQQQQQQMYFPQGAHTHVNTATYGHPSMNGVIPGYGYAHTPGPMPSYSSGMQTPVYHHQNQYFQGGVPVMSHPIMHQQLQQLQQFQQGRSNSMDSDGSVPTSLSRRDSIQHSVVSSARASEDSWNDALQHQLQHSNSVLSTQKTANSDSGYSGVASDHGKHTSFDDSLEDIQTTIGSEYEKVSTNSTKSKIDDVTKVIENFSISQAAAAAADKDSDGDDEDSESSDSDSDSDSDDDDKSEGSDSDSEQDDDPESLKGSTVIDSIRYGGFKGATTTGSSSSAAASNNGSNEHDDEHDSSDDDDQPIILSRRNSARGVFLPALGAAGSAGIKISAEEAAMMSGVQIMTPSQQQQMSVPT